MDKRLRRQLTFIFFLLFSAIALVGLPLEQREWLVGNSSAQKKSEPSKATIVADKKTELDHVIGNTPNGAATRPSTAPPEEMGMAERSPAAYDSTWDRDYPQDQRKKLMAFPDLRPGDIPPVKLYLYGGVGRSSYASIDDVADFKEFYERLSKQKPAVMARWKAYLNTRYEFTGKTDPTATMSRSKPLPVGPIVKLPEGIKSWEELANLTPEEILKRDLFPEGFRPLAHPLQSTGHMLFSDIWLAAHPENTRFDVDFDIPSAYLPEFPPPLFLTTRPDLGDVSRGEEITEANFHRLFNGIITPEQLKGLEKLVIKSNTSWFNQTKRRLTRLPSQGIACFDCHVNGHTNAAIELDPGQRPTLGRVRLDTPTLRGNNLYLLFSRSRSIRSVDHFAEVEEYFDGDVGLAQQIGGREFNKGTTNVMGDFNSIIALSPAPKLDRYGRLIPAKASPAELRGEKLFFGKANCSSCHAAPFYVDNQMHDLRLEEFYFGRAEGWVKTFGLRGIKDSPPYLHDGRLPTLEDTVEFFNIVFQLKLEPTEKNDLVSFLRVL
ncbi:MAG: cytochrome C [Acidobacteriota bacterium]